MPLLENRTLCGLNILPCAKRLVEGVFNIAFQVRAEATDITELPSEAKLLGFGFDEQEKGSPYHGDIELCRRTPLLYRIGVIERLSSTFALL
jgi:hypothetical protein